MDDLKILKLSMVFSFPILLFLILFCALLCNESASGESSVIVANSLSLPFNKDTNWSVTSKYGNRYDPISHERFQFHSGIDLGTSCGTDVIASANGIVVEVGYNENGLGNYVYLKHNTDTGILYTAYGHMLDDSIVVINEQPINAGDKIGSVGSTGYSTGCHLHFSIAKEELSFDKQHTIDPNFVVNGLK